MSIQAIVTKPRGSWIWQDAYGISTYEPYVTKTGRVLLRSVSQSSKYSWPQLRHRAKNLPQGSLHNVPPTTYVVDDYGNLVAATYGSQSVILYSELE